MNLEDYYFQVKKWFLIGYSVLSVVWIVDGTVILGIEEYFHIYRIPQTVGVIVPLFGLGSTSRRTHLFISVAVLAVLLSATVVRFMPGAF